MAQVAVRHAANCDISAQISLLGGEKQAGRRSSKRYLKNMN